MPRSKLFLASAALFFLPVEAYAQEPPQPADPKSQPAEEPQPADDEFEGEDSDEIVVTGAKPRGSVIGDIPPETVLDSRDVRATGATNIDELLEALEPQIGSARGRGEGGRPILLLNGQRISGFRELRDIPTEAISRVEILPEEVALKYGYRADQRVVNIVLRERFRSTAVSLEGTAATEGGYAGGEADLTRLMIGEDSRTTIDLDVETNSSLTEDERDIFLEPDDTVDDRSARTLIASRRLFRGTATHNRMIGSFSATGNVELQRNEGRSLIGLGATLLQPLARNTSNDSAHVGGVLNGNIKEWSWSLTGNADASRSVTETDRDSGIRDRAVSRTLSGDLDAVANGNLLRLQAGDAGATVRLGASTLHLDSDRNRQGAITSNSLGRTRASAAANLDLPVSRRNSAFASLGNLTVNGNAEVEQLSDFGTLTTVGAGLSWSPVRRLDLIASWTREGGAPTVQQLGDPILETPDTRIFDFTTGETVLVTAITGGNPDLGADRRDVLKLGANWRPLEDVDLRLRADYVRSSIADPISSFPGPTAELEEAFPDRFVRNAEGELISVDLRPVNFESSRRDTLRLGFDITRPLRSARPSQAAIESFRARRAGGQEGQTETFEGAEGSRGGGFRGLGRFGGGRQGGRLTFSLTDTITLVDEAVIRPGLPELDYLRGDALGQSGGRPRHLVEARAGYFNNGIGARLSANWRSGTEVKTSTGDELRFSPLATFDLRLWANLGQRFDLVAKQPWLRGTSLRLEVRNLFNARPKVRDAAGNVPFGYQPDLLDPLGRTIGITFRKLFLPPRSAFRRGEGRPPGGDD